MDIRCKLGLHKWNYTGQAYTFAPQVIRCLRCGQEY